MRLVESYYDKIGCFAGEYGRIEELPHGQIYSEWGLWGNTHVV